VESREGPRRALIARIGPSGLVLAIVASAFVVVAGAGTAETAALPTGLPLLTYVASNGGFCLVRADGSHAFRLTPRWKKIGVGAWSPGGRYLAFVKQTTNDGRSKIFVATARGKIRWRLGVGLYDGGPLWSPDGRHILYYDGWAHVYGYDVARMDGTHDVGIASSPGFPTYGPNDPTWIPGGQRVAFDDGNFVDTTQGIFTVALNGSDRRLLVGDALSPAFSPDGEKLAYVAFHRTQPYVNEQGGLYIADADGTNPRLLVAQTGNRPNDLSWSTPAWSPDGTRLAFRQDTPLYGSAMRSDVVVARADGGGERVIASAASPSSAVLSAPVWSPGGRYLAFERYDTRAVTVARADGGGRRLVVARTSGGFAWHPFVALPAVKRPACPRR
jgi:Tol biopolymer transport system component